MKKMYIILVCLLAIKANAQTENAPKRSGWIGSALYGRIEWLEYAKYELRDSLGKEVKGAMLERKEYYFNRKGDVNEIIHYNENNCCVEKSINKYDSSGNSTECSRYNRDGLLEDKLLFKHDSIGNMTEIALYNNDGTLVVKFVRKYDKQGNWIEEATYRDGVLNSIATFKYNQQKDKTEYNCYHNDSTKSYMNQKLLYKYKYDSNGSKIEVEKHNYYKGQLFLDRKICYRYDLSGKMIEKCIFNRKGELLEKYIYQYDDQGNVINEVLYKSEALIPVFVKEYIILYRGAIAPDI